MSRARNTANVIQGVETLTNKTLSTGSVWNGGAIPALYGGTGLTSPGTSGNVLTSNGSAWTSGAAPAGNLVLLGTVNASAASAVEFTSQLTSTYKVYKVFGSDFRLSAATSFYMRVYTSSTLRTATEYTYAFSSVLAASGSAIINDNGYPGFGAQEFRFFSAATATDSAALANLELTIYNPADTTKYKLMDISFVSGLDGKRLYAKSGGLMYTGDTGALTGIRFFPVTGTVTGTFYIYGVKP